MKCQIAYQLYEWAIERSQRERDRLHSQFPKLDDWITGKKQPSFKQLEKFAKAVYLPTAVFFMPKPPEESLPIADFRTFGKEGIGASIPPSPHLLDTIYDCQLKQDWYVNYCRLNGEEKNTFTGSFTLRNNPLQVAKAIRENFDISIQSYPSVQVAFAKHKETIEKQGILVMTSGTVKGNTHRPLDIEEFRGFALSNEYAPLIFINAKDTEAARSFTLMHELAHIAIGKSGLSNDLYEHQVEKWCDRVAGEILVPKNSLQDKYDENADIFETIKKLANFYKVSTLVILLQLRNARLLNKSENEFWQIYNEEKKRLLGIKNYKTKSGGDYYNSKPAAISKRFLRALAMSAREGQTLYRDAMSLANVKNIKTFHTLANDALLK